MEKPNSRKLEIRIGGHQHGLRIDKALSEIPEIGSRSRAEILIENNHVLLNHKPVKPSQKVVHNDLVEVQIPEPQDLELRKFDFPLDIFFEDDSIMVVNKPPGLVVHPAAGHEADTLVNALVSYSDEFLMKFSDRRPGIVHRLDKETSGLLVIAKNDFSLEALAKQFKERSVHRIYQAIVVGRPIPSRGKIASYLARHPVHRQKYASLLGVDRKPIRTYQPLLTSGKWAVTNYEVQLTHPSGLSLIELKLETGRTHQIRVHLSEMGVPILSDPLYGNRKKERSLGGKSLQEILQTSKRCALHAKELGFHHPNTGTFLKFAAEWPDHHEILEVLGYKPAQLEKKK